MINIYPCCLKNTLETLCCHPISEWCFPSVGNNFGPNILARRSQQCFPVLKTMPDSWYSCHVSPPVSCHVHLSLPVSCHVHVSAPVSCHVHVSPPVCHVHVSPPVSCLVHLSPPVSCHVHVSPPVSCLVHVSPPVSCHVRVTTSQLSCPLVTTCQLVDTNSSL